MATGTGHHLSPSQKTAWLRLIRTPGVLKRIGQDRKRVKFSAVQHSPTQSEDRGRSPLGIHVFALAFL